MIRSTVARVDLAALQANFRAIRDFVADGLPGVGLPGLVRTGRAQVGVDDPDDRAVGREQRFVSKRLTTQPVALGGMGFANWAREVAQQEAELGIFFDHVIVCTVTGSTHAGMIAGFAGATAELVVRRGPDNERVYQSGSTRMPRMTGCRYVGFARSCARRLSSWPVSRRSSTASSGCSC